MKRKALSLLIVLVLVTALCPAVLADNSMSRVYDNEGLFDDFDIDLLNEKLAEVSSTYEVDVAIVTAASLDGKSAEAYADDFYDETGIGQGENKDGIILLLSSSERKYAVSTSGYAIFAFPDAYIDAMCDEFVPYMSDGDWYGACMSFIESCGVYLVKAYDDPSGTTPDNFDPDDFDGDYDDDYEPITDPDGYDSSGHSPLYFSPVWFAAALFIGIIAALIVLSSMKSGMKTVKMQSAASDYVRPGSFALTESRDTYLYMTVTRTAKPKDDGGSGGGGSHHGGFGSGGNFSSTHTSSSGSMHGGRSGSF